MVGQNFYEALNLTQISLNGSQIPLRAAYYNYKFQTDHTVLLMECKLL